MTSLRIAFLSNCAARDVYLIREVAALCEPCAVFKLVGGNSHPRKPGSRLARFAAQPLTLLSAKARHFVHQRLFARQEQRVAELLFGASKVPTIPNAVDTERYRVNSEEMAQRLSFMDLDFLFLSGAPVLRPEIFTVPRYGTINVHYGIAPKYRGEFTLFWPLYYRDPQGVGITIHYVEKGIDTGNVLARWYPELTENDGEIELSAKAARLAAEGLKDILRDTAAVMRPPSGVAQRRQDGRLYRYRERLLKHTFHEIILRRFHRNPSFHLPQRTEILYRPTVKAEAPTAKHATA